MKHLIVLFSILLFLCGCSEKNDSSYINVAVSQEPVTTDVMVNTSLTGRLILVGSVYERLVVLDGEGNVRPELAESFYLSEDGKSLSFKIRKGVRFHDGTDLNEEDVVYSLNRWLNVYSKAREMVGDNDFYVDVNGEVTISSENNLTFLPILMASSPQSAVIFPKEYIEKNDELITGAPGTGPYVLKEWISGEKMVLSSFLGYQSYSKETNGAWGEKRAESKEISFYFVPDSTTRILGLKSGEYDFINDLMSDDRVLIEKDENLETVDGEESGLIALVFNKKEGVFVSEELRKAAALSFDREELMKSCYGDYGWTLNSQYMEKETGFWSEKIEDPTYSRDMETARTLLSSNYDGREIKILTSNLSNLEKIAYAAESELEEAGFKVKVVVTDWAGMMEKRKDSSEWDIFISAFTKVPLPQMKSFLAPTYPGWMESESDAYLSFLSIDEEVTIKNAEERWEEVQKELWEYIPAYIPGHYSTSYAKNKKLQGVIIQDGFYFWNAYVER
ncbi:MAG: ABC transporter substrate-binding protein [Spirochaetales bacterium]|nr:ABC transporter substrate-binding protein [Spirochaetales bacterium]